MIKLNVYLAIIILAISTFLLPILLLLFVKNKKTLKILSLVLLIIYLAILGVGVFSNVDIENHYLIVNFSPKGHWFNASSFIYYNFDLINVCVNLFMFIPIGMAFYVLFEKKKFLKTLIFSLFISILIEFGQFALPVARTVELTDLLYNSISGVLGFVIMLLVDKLKTFIVSRKTN